MGNAAYAATAVRVEAPKEAPKAAAVEARMAELEETLDADTLLSFADAVVRGESARACSSILSSEVQKTGEFWLLTFWLLIWTLPLYLRVF